MWTFHDKKEKFWSRSPGLPSAAGSTSYPDDTTSIATKSTWGVQLPKRKHVFKDWNAHLVDKTGVDAFSSDWFRQ